MNSAGTGKDKVATFEAKVAESPDNLLYRFSLAQALYGRSPSEAIPHLKLCCEGRADWMIPRILLGKAYLQAGNSTESKEVLEDALRLAIQQNHKDPATEVRQLLEDL